MIWGCVCVLWSEGSAVKAADKEQPEKPGDRAVVGPCITFSVSFSRDGCEGR